MKDPRNPGKWTNEEISEAPRSYLAAQQARREDEAAGRAREPERRDREHFEREFVAAGGSRSEAEDAWPRRRDERAAEAAGHAACSAARRVQRSASMGAI